MNGKEEVKPIKTFEWIYGMKPDLKLNFESKIKKLGEKGIEIIFFTDTFEAKQKKLKDFIFF